MQFPFNFGWGNFYSLTLFLLSFDKSFIALPVQIFNGIRRKIRDDLPQMPHGSPHILWILAMTEGMMH